LSADRPRLRCTSRLVALGGHLGAALGGQTLDVTGADLDTGKVQGEGGVGRGVQPGIGFSDHLQHGRAVTVVVQTQRGPQGGKS
jgi:hypothetical protein